jgi:hypothetical protein
MKFKNRKSFRIAYPNLFGIKGFVVVVVVKKLLVLLLSL